jgi:hypothetical protein
MFFDQGVDDERAVEPSEPALDHAPRGAEIEMPPALGAVLLDLQATRAAARAQRSLGAQDDGDDHPLRTERHIPDPCTRKLKHPVNAVVTRTSPSFADR